MLVVMMAIAILAVGTVLNFHGSIPRTALDLRGGARLIEKVRILQRSTVSHESVVCECLARAYDSES